MTCGDRVAYGATAFTSKCLGNSELILRTLDLVDKRWHSSICRVWRTAPFGRHRAKVSLGLWALRTGTSSRSS